MMLDKINLHYKQLKLWIKYNIYIYSYGVNQKKN